MKELVKKIVMIMVFMFFPLVVFASGDITASPTSLTIEKGKTATITIKAVNTIGDVTISSSNNNIVKVNSSSWETGMIDEGTTKTGSVTITGISDGTAVITLKLDASTFDGEDLSGKTRKVNVTVKTSSTNNNLSSLKIDGEVISGFSSLVTTYSLKTDNSTINIGATLEDSKAKVSGTGTKTLKYGNNKFEVKVTAENGSVKKYILNITRNDNRDSNNYLASLSIDKGDIVFDKNTFSYKTSVEKNISKISIKASAESEKAKVSGTGAKTLKYGNNKFEVKVTAENGSVKKYILNINRDDGRSDDNTLSNLSIEGLNINFDKNVKEYELSVSKETTSINISANANDGKAKVEGTGKKELKDGENFFTIKVTAENGAVETYTIKVTKKEVVAKYTITYDANGGKSCEPNTKIVEEGDSIGTLCVTSREGYIFNGWFTSSIDGLKISENEKINKDLTIYAQWNKIKQDNSSKLMIIIIVIETLTIIILLIALLTKKKKIDNIM